MAVNVYSQTCSLDKHITECISSDTSLSLSSAKNWMMQQLHLHTLFQPYHYSGTAMLCAHAFSSHWTCAQLLNVNTWRKVNLHFAKKCLSEALITLTWKGIILINSNRMDRWRKVNGLLLAVGGPLTFPFLHCGHANDYNVLKLSHLAIIWNWRHLYLLQDFKSHVTTYKYLQNVT